MGFPEADPPLFTCFSASSAALSIQCSSPLKVDPLLPSSPPQFDLGLGVASMGFPEADPPLLIWQAVLGGLLVGPIDRLQPLHSVLVVFSYLCPDIITV